MKLKNSKNKQFIEKYNITQPTDLFTQDGYIIFNKKVTRKFGLSFSGFMSALLTKYQSLTKSKAFVDSGREEFWYTERDSSDDLHMSYYIRKKMIKIGVDYGLWTCEAKYNPMFRGIINKTDHFIINWDNVIEFLAMLDNSEIEIDFDIDKVEFEAFEEEAQALERQLEQYENKEIKAIITTQETEEFINDIKDFAEEMSLEKGVRSPKSYKLSIIEKALAKDKKTLTKLKLWMNDKKKTEEIFVENNNFSYLKNHFIFYQNIKFYVKGALHKKNDIFVKAQDELGNKIIITIQSDSFESFRESFIYDGFANVTYKNYDTGENVNG